MVFVKMLILSNIDLKVSSAFVVTRKSVPPYDVDWRPELYRKSLVLFDEVILCTPWPVIIVSWSIITMIWWCRKSSARLDFLLLLFSPWMLSVTYFDYFIVLLFVAEDLKNLKVCWALSSTFRYRKTNKQKRSAIRNFIDRGYGRKKKRPLVKTTTLLSIHNGCLFLLLPKLSRNALRLFWTKLSDIVYWNTVLFIYLIFTYQCFKLV